MTEIVKRPESAPVPTTKSDWVAIATQAQHNPLLLVPAECRSDVSRLWMCNAGLFASNLDLCATIRVYMDEEGITAADVAEIVAKLLRPERRMHHKFRSDVLTDLSFLVVETIDRREAEDRRRGDRDKHDREKREAVGGVALGSLFPKPE